MEDNGWSTYTPVQKLKIRKRRRIVVVRGPDKRHSTTRILEDGECEGQSALLDKLKEVRSAMLKDKSVAPPPSDTPSQPQGSLSTNRAILGVWELNFSRS